MGLKSFIGCKVRIKSKWQFQWGVFFVVLVVVVATSVKRGSSHNLINVLAVRCLLRSPQRISAISFPFPLSNNLQYISYKLLCLECKRHIQRKGLEKDFKVHIRRKNKWQWGTNMKSDKETEYDSHETWQLIFLSVLRLSSNKVVRGQHDSARHFDTLILCRLPCWTLMWFVMMDGGWLSGKAPEAVICETTFEVRPIPTF